MNSISNLIIFTSLLMILPGITRADEAAERRERAMQFHLRAMERSGLLIPLYVYPADIHMNPVYNRLIELKRRYESVPMWVIINPASGPGKTVDANYTKAIDRLQGAGCVTLGYVSTNYSQRPANEIKADLATWQKLYPRIQGVFFDEMIYEDNDAGVKFMLDLKRAARDAGSWPIVANPGTDTPGRYFAANVADVIVMHEGDQLPDETKLKGDYFRGYSDYPPFTRGVLIHSHQKYDSKSLAMIRKYARWVYFTDDPYRPGDPKADNPWDTLSGHLEEVCADLARRDGRESK